MKKLRNGLFAVLLMTVTVVLVHPEEVHAAGHRSGYSPAVAIEESSNAVIETQEVDVYDYEQMEEIIGASVSLKSSSSSESERRAWMEDTLEEALLTYTEEIDVSGYNITVEDLLVASVNVINADYRFCYVDSSYAYSYYPDTRIVVKIYLDYTAEEEEAMQMLAELEEAIDEVVSGADSSWSDMEKALYINDYLCRTCEYDDAESGEDHTAYGALVEHCTVCEGYAKAFYVLGERLGLNCGVVVSWDMEHEWSYVQIGDSYYYVDVTWDEPYSDLMGQVGHSYFLKSYSYFHSTAGGHTSNDWIYSDNETELSSQNFGNTSYDEYFWDDIEQGFEYADGYWYTIQDRDLEAYVCNGTSFEYKATLFTISDLWYVWGDEEGDYYSDGYSYIASYDGMLYYSTPKAIWEYDVSAYSSSGLDTDNADDEADTAVSAGAEVYCREVYTLSDEYAEKGYIYGICMMIDGDLDIRLATGSSSSATVGTYTVLELNTEDQSEIEDCTILVDDSAVVYDGTQKLPEITITDGTYTLVEGLDYVITTLNNISPGEKTLYITGIGSYTGIVKKSFTISKMEQVITATVESSSIRYGSTTTITASTSGDGAISYSSDNTSVAAVSGSGGTATVTAAGTGTAVITITAAETELYVSATQTITITVEAIDISSATVTLGTASYTYNGSAREPFVTVTLNGTTATGSSTTTTGSSTTGTGSSIVLTKGTDYTVSYSNNTNAGTATVTITGCGNYTGTATATFTISKASQTLTAAAGSSSVACGKTTTIAAATTGDGAISYSSSNTSIATVDSNGKITGKAVGTATITVAAAATSNYTAATKTIQITVKPAATTITSVKNTGTGVKITWEKVDGATGYYVYRATSANGTYTKIATITSGSTVTCTNKTSGNYKVSSGKTYYYKVSAYASTGAASRSDAKSIRYLTAGKISSLTNVSGGITIKWSKVSGASGYYIYRKASSESKYTKVATITKASTVSYTNKTSGTYKVVNGTTYTYYVIPYYKNSSGSITKGSYSATKKTVRLTAVKISSLKNSASKALTVKYGRNSKATGYQIQYSTSSSFTSSKTTSVYVSGASTLSKKVTKLTKGKTYYVRIRAYKKVSGTKYYSAWSGKKSVKISK